MKRVMVIANEVGEFICMQPYLFENITTIVLYPPTRKNQSQFADVTLYCDVSDYKSCTETFNSIYERFNKIDIILNYVTKCEKSVNGIDFNLDWIYNVTHSGAMIIKKQDSGKIINIFPNEFLDEYPASRAGVLAFVRTLKEIHPSYLMVENINVGSMSSYDVANAVGDLIEN